uniref:Uncharacterized protein n=1 Tax=Amazona collaria TaxID=241587 RepID=A0A8B9GJ43_9PSIT
MGRELLLWRALAGDRGDDALLLVQGSICRPRKCHRQRAAPCTALPEQSTAMKLFEKETRTRLIQVPCSTGEQPMDVPGGWAQAMGGKRSSGAATTGPCDISLQMVGVKLQAILWQLFTVLPAPTSSLWDPNHCRTCAVVGNSGWLKGSGHGLQIDAHDWVLRMNRAKIAGFELDVGMRTTHHFMYPESAVDLQPGVHLVLVPFKPLDLLWVASHGEHLMAPPLPTQVLILSPAFLKYIHDNWTQHHGRYPSTGFTALLFALHACQQVSVFGFGADTEGNWHHYWEKNRWSGAFRRTRVHNADVEFSLVERLAAEGRILFYR